MRARHGIRVLIGIAALLAFAPLADAAVGHGASGAGIAKLVANVKPAAASAPASPKGMGEAAGWTGGILALQGFRTLAEPLTRGLAAGLGKLLPGGAAGKLAAVATEFFSGAALKVGMDAGEGLVNGKLEKPDWLEVGAAAAGMVLGGQLGKMIGGPIGDCIGSWIGWSLGESLVKQFRGGEKLNIVKAFTDIDFPRMILQATAIEGASLIAPGIASGGILGAGVQIGLTLVASVAANGLADQLSGKREDDDDAAAAEAKARAAYEKFVAESKARGAGSSAALSALGEYRAAKARVEQLRRETASR